jgi:hypothetical protein
VEEDAFEAALQCYTGLLNLVEAEVPILRISLRHIRKWRVVRSSRAIECRNTATLDALLWRVFLQKGLMKTNSEMYIARLAGSRRRQSLLYIMLFIEARHKYISHSGDTTLGDAIQQEVVDRLTVTSSYSSTTIMGQAYCGLLTWT